MQRGAIKLKLSRLLALKKLLRTNQFGRLEQLSALTDLGEHSALGSLHQLSTLGLLTKDIKQTLLLNLTAGIRVAARSCVESSGRGLLRPYAVVTRKQERILFARNKLTGATKKAAPASTRITSVYNKALVKNSFAGFRALYNLQAAGATPTTNTDLVLIPAKHPVSAYNKVRKLLVEQSVDELSTPVLSPDSCVQVTKSRDKLASRYRARLRAGERDPKLRVTLRGLSAELRTSAVLQTTISRRYAVFKSQQKRATTKQKYSRRKFLQKRALPATGFRAATRYSLPLSKVASNYTGEVRTVSTQQL